MSQRNKYESPFDKKARIIGLSLTVLFHVALLFVCVKAGLKYIYPPPPEQGILLEFVQEDPKPVQVKVGVEPRAKKADPDKEVRLVQKSEAPQVGTMQNKSVESTVGTEGDVETPEPPRPKPIDRRALFSSSRNKQDTLSQQTADRVSDALRAGQPDGNTDNSGLDGSAVARLEGRSAVGNLPQPTYDIEKAGKVVVTIRVDQLGTVTNAIPGAQGTTVQDATLWKAAQEAALKAKFNKSSDAPAVQEGTITYIFKLN